jgi:hypothetical protein
MAFTRERQHRLARKKPTPPATEKIGFKVPRSYLLPGYELRWSSDGKVSVNTYDTILPHSDSNSKTEFDIRTMPGRACDFHLSVATSPGHLTARASPLPPPAGSQGIRTYSEDSVTV